MSAPLSASLIEGSDSLKQLATDGDSDNGNNDGNGDDHDNDNEDNSIVEDANIQYLMTSTDFGKKWTWAPFPSNLQATGLAMDPTSPNKLFAFTSSCLSHSEDHGKVRLS